MTIATPPVDPDATRLVDLYERHGPAILKFCTRRLGDRDAAEDAAQVTFMRALRGLQRGATLEFESAWLYTIAQNVCLNAQRSAFRRRRLETPLGFDDIEQLHLPVERDADDLFGLEVALQSMSPNQRAAIVLREWRGWSYDEIAKALGVSRAAVETLLFRARKTLAQALRGTRRVASELGSLLTLAKTLLAGGGAKVGATLVATVATCVCVASPELRQALLHDLGEHPDVLAAVPVAAETVVPHDPAVRAHTIALLRPVRRAEHHRAARGPVPSAPRVAKAHARHIVARLVVEAPVGTRPVVRRPFVEDAADVSDAATPPAQAADAPSPTTAAPAPATTTAAAAPTVAQTTVAHGTPAKEPAPAEPAGNANSNASPNTNAEAPGPCGDGPAGSNPDPGSGGRALGHCHAAAPAENPAAAPPAAETPAPAEADHGNLGAEPPGQVAKADEEPPGQSDEPHGKSDEPHGKRDEPHGKNP